MHARHSKENTNGGFALTLFANVLVLAQAVPQGCAFTFNDHVYIGAVDVHRHFEDREIIRVIRHEVVISAVEEPALRGRAKDEAYQRRT